ncbi:hypothetical protein Hanom_Chr17g01555451 [Helianthus anomalus]
MFVSFFRFNDSTGRMAFYKFVSTLTLETLVIPARFSKKWLSSAIGGNTTIIKCINGMLWEDGKRLWLTFHYQKEV